MPKRASKVCATPGCPNINCQVHARPRRKPDRRPSAARRGYDKQWRRIRGAYLARHPQCIVCGAPAEEVDHIVALSAGGTNQWSNLQAMCKHHHSQKTVAVDGGFGRNE